MTPRILITVIIIFNFLLVLGQEVSLHIYVKCCNGEIYPIEFHMIETASETGFGKIDTGNVVVLPDTGLYYLHYTEDPILIHVNNFGINYDTINDCYLASVIDIKTDEEYWKCCNVRCDGYIIGYHDNGNKKVEGYFKKGKAIGPINFYEKKDGSLSTILYYNKRGKYKKREDY